MSRHHALQHVITDEQEANLRKGAEGLMNLPPDRPFDMEFYRGDDSDPSDTHDCGTSGCALGYFPMWVSAKQGESWRGYERRATGLTFIFNWGVYAFWAWCFDEGWAEIDNTPQGAARRILYLLDNGLPDDWRAQMTGHAPYMFAEATS